MQDSFQFNRTLPLNAAYDVLVIGGGPAGCAAAASAAREGAKTLLIEATGALGGMGTSGLVPAFAPFFDKEKIIYRGLAQRILETMKRGMPHVEEDRLFWVPIDPERLKRVYDDLMCEFGVDVLFNTALTTVNSANGDVQAVVVNNKSGLTAYRAEVYVDCTGDADLAAWAGAEFQKGDEQGEMQPATLCFTLTNVDTYGFLHRYGPFSGVFPPWKTIAKEIVASEKYPLLKALNLNGTMIGPSTVGFNMGHVDGVDNTDPASVSQGLMTGRRIAEQARDALAEFFPQAFANAFLVNSGSLLGIRETRRIIGDYVLTREDYLARQSFPDDICRNSNYLDIHTRRDKPVTDSCEYAAGESHGIPYRCLTPKGLSNVLVAGRCVSCDRIVQGSIRVMPPCLAMGEAAGLAAALAAMATKNVHDIDIDRLRQRLRKEGAYLP